jgi:hypothetical protein
LNKIAAELTRDKSVLDARRGTLVPAARVFSLVAEDRVHVLVGNPGPWNLAEIDAERILTMQRAAANLDRHHTER